MTRASIAGTKWTTALVANHVGRCIFKEDGTGILAFANSTDPTQPIFKYVVRWEFRTPNWIKVEIAEQAKDLRIETIRVQFWGSELTCDAKFHGFTGLRKFSMMPEAEFLDRFHRLDAAVLER